MWHLVKSEFKYNWKEFLLLGLFLLLYTIVVLFNYSAIASVTNTSKDIFGWFFYAFFYIIFIKQLKTKREKHFGILPISNNDIAVSRLVFSTIPFIISIMFFAIIQLVLIDSKQSDVNDIITSLGNMFSLIAAFILVRDKWFSYSDLGEKLGAVFIYGVITLGLLITFSFIFKIKHKSIIHIWGLPYDNIQYFLLGLVIMAATIFSYQKRKSYLS